MSHVEERIEEIIGRITSLDAASRRKLLAIVLITMLVVVVVALYERTRPPPQVEVYVKGIYTSRGKKLCVHLTSDASQVRIISVQCCGVEKVIGADVASNTTFCLPFPFRGGETVVIKYEGGEASSIVDAETVDECSAQYLASFVNASEVYSLYSVIVSNKAESRERGLVVSALETNATVAIVAPRVDERINLLTALLHNAGIRVSVLTPSSHITSLPRNATIIIFDVYDNLSALYFFATRGGRVAWIGEPPGYLVYADGEISESNVLSPDRLIFGEHIADPVRPFTCTTDYGTRRIVALLSPQPSSVRVGFATCNGKKRPYFVEMRIGRGMIAYYAVDAKNVTPYEVLAVAGMEMATQYSFDINPHDAIYTVVAVRGYKPAVILLCPPGRVRSFGGGKP